MDVKLAAKYPFLKGASAYLRETGVDLNKLTTSVAYERARFMGKE
ncbi:MAG: DNA primase regulatory subunit PriL, partial [Methanomassiliicoccus sp.]